MPPPRSAASPMLRMHDGSPDAHLGVGDDVSPLRDRGGGYTHFSRYSPNGYLHAMAWYTNVGPVHAGRGPNNW